MSQPADEQTRPEVTIDVNHRSVVVSGHHVTGLEVKEAAMAYGVPIDLDFQLAMPQNSGNRIIGNDDVVRIEPGTKFVATAPDDNS